MITRYLTLATLLVALWMSLFTTSNGDEPVPSPADALQETIQAWKQHFSPIGLPFTAWRSESPQSDAILYETASIDDCEYVRMEYGVGASKVTTIAFANPEYVAKIAREGEHVDEKQGWRLELFARKGDNDYLDVSRTLRNYFRTPEPIRFGSFNLVELLSNPDNFRIENATDRTDDDGVTIREFDVSVNDHVYLNDAPVNFKKFSFGVNVASGHLPTRIESQFRLGDRAIDQIKTVGNWEQADGRVVWNTLEWDNVDPRTKAKSRVYRISRIPNAEQKKLSEEACLLSFYGLPEPDSSDHLRLWAVILNVGVIMLVAVFFWKKRRDSARGLA